MGTTSRLIFGCGYLGERVARRWRDAGDEVVIVTRSSDRANAFDVQGYRTIVADVTRPETLAHLPATNTVLFAVGYDRSAAPAIGEVYAGGMRNVLAALPADAGRFLYISTTGVYGDAKGAWVDEQTPPDPQRAGGRAALAAESILAAHPLATRSVVLRLAGIYGPGRIPFRNELRAAAPIPAPTHGFLNLIHVDDAAAIVVAAGQLAPTHREPRLFCVSDGRPVQRGEFYREVARQLGAPPPRFVDPEAHSPRATRAATDRRIRNDRVLAALPVALAYPDYRAGLAAILPC